MFDLIENELKKKENYSVTENGAIGYKSTSSALLDLNYQVSGLRSGSEEEIVALFDKAFSEEKEYTLKWLFFARDIREGLGERRLFRICYKRLAFLDKDLFIKNLDIISEYGRWDDMVSLIGIDDILDIEISKRIKAQLIEDKINKEKNEPISLLGKWLPSENASSKETKKLAKKVMSLLGMSPRKYRLLLSEVRAYLRVIETQMCNNKWGDIDYEKVPSMANLKYKEAFLRHDFDRREAYLESLKKGKAKMNMKAANPVDIVSRYSHFRAREDATLEMAWKNLKDIDVKDTLVVADGSGSMMFPVSKSTSALDVATALAIYTSEHNDGVYKDKYITFSFSPRFVDMSEKKSLREKISFSRQHNEVANTNIEAVFDLILSIAKENSISQDEMIKNILIISDMEFDRAQNCSYIRERNPLTKPLFEEIKGKYEEAGYKLPKLIFWNVISRTKTIPLIENELGVTLLSGFSQNVLKMVMSNKYDPYAVLIETLDNERYDKVSF